LEAVVHAMSQREQDYESQVAQLKGSVRLMEADAAACGRRTNELESELTSMRMHQENGAPSCDMVYAARIAELEAAVEAHAKRNAENEAVMKSMQEREGRIAKLEQALTSQMQPMPPNPHAASISMDWPPAAPHEAPKAERIHSEPVSAVGGLSQNFNFERKVTSVNRVGDDVGLSPSHSPVPQHAVPSAAVTSVPSAVPSQQFPLLPPKAEPGRFAGSVVIPSSGTGGGSVQFSSIKAPRAGSMVCNVSPKTSTRMPSLGSAKEGGQQQGEAVPPRPAMAGINAIGPTFGSGQFAGLFGTKAVSPGRMSGASPARIRAASPCVARGVSPVRSPVSCGLPTFGCSQGAPNMRNASPIRPRADMQQPCGPMMRSASPVRMNSTPHSLPGFNPSKAGNDQPQPASRMTPLHELANKNCH